MRIGARTRGIYRLLIALLLFVLLNLGAVHIDAKEAILGAMSPAWSPDGRHIAYVVASQQHQELYVVGVDSPAPVKLTENALDLSWSPDGTRLAYSDYSGGGSVIYTIKPDGSGRVKVGVGCCSGWSPDGRQITFILRDGELWIANPDGSAPHSLVKNAGLQFVGHGCS